MNKLVTFIFFLLATTILFSGCNDEKDGVPALSPEPIIDEPTPPPASSLTTTLPKDKRIKLAFLGETAFELEYVNLVNDVKDNLENPDFTVVEDSKINITAIDNFELRLNLDLKQDDDNSINAFVASFRDFAEISNVCNLYLAILLDAPELREDGEYSEYIGLFFSDRLDVESVLVRDVIQVGFRDIVQADNIKLLMRDDTNVRQALRSALDNVRAGCECSSNSVQIAKHEKNNAGIARHILRNVHILIDKPNDTNLSGKNETQTVTDLPETSESVVPKTPIISDIIPDIPDLVPNDSSFSFIFYKDEIGNRWITLTVEATIEDEGSLSYQWYRVIEDNAELIPNETSNQIRVSTDSLGTFLFRIEVTNTLDNGATEKVTSMVQIDIIDDEPSRTEEFEIYFNGYRDMLEVVIIDKAEGIAYSGNQLNRLKKILDEYVIDNPNVVRIRIDGRYFDKSGLQQDGGLTLRRAEAVKLAMERYGVVVPIYTTGNLIQTDVDWRQRRVTITIVFDN